MTNKKCNSLLFEVMMALCSEILITAGLAPGETEARAELLRSLDSPKATKRFGQIVVALAGPIDFIQRYDRYLPIASV